MRSRAWTATATAGFRPGRWFFHALILVANSAWLGQAVSGCSRAKAQCRVCAFGSPASHLSNRTRFIAAAVMRWARCVFACPKYGVRRSRVERTPCAIVPSIPARRAYSIANSVVCSRARPMRNASCRASGRIVIARRAEVERVHCGRSGQARQSATENLILITGVVPRASAGVQLWLTFPAGHVARCWAKSMAKSRAANPAPA